MRWAAMASGKACGSRSHAVRDDAQQTGLLLGKFGAGTHVESKQEVGISAPEQINPPCLGELRHKGRRSFLQPLFLEAQTLIDGPMA
jgi:hypothetical protein